MIVQPVENHNMMKNWAITHFGPFKILRSIDLPPRTGCTVFRCHTVAVIELNTERVICMVTVQGGLEMSRRRLETIGERDYGGGRGVVGRNWIL